MHARRLYPFRWIVPVLAGLVVPACGAPDAPLVSVVFDIDGTLTPDPGDFNDARPHAAEAVQTYVDKGYAVVYVTARPEPLEPAFETTAFLEREGFPDCPLFEAPTLLIDFLDPGQTELYKTSTLMELGSGQHRTFQFGYGDSGSDFASYRSASVPFEHVFALKRCPEGECESWCKRGDYPPNNCLSGYADRDHLDYIRDLPPANEGRPTRCRPF